MIKSLIFANRLLSNLFPLFKDIPPTLLGPHFLPKSKAKKEKKKKKGKGHAGSESDIIGSLFEASHYTLDPSVSNVSSAHTRAHFLLLLWEGVAVSSCSCTGFFFNVVGPTSPLSPPIPTWRIFLAFLLSEASNFTSHKFYSVGCTQ